MCGLAVRLAIETTAWLAETSERCGARLHYYRMLSWLALGESTHPAHLRAKATSVLFSNMAAKGLNEDVTFELVPLTCFVGLSEGGFAS